MADLQRGDNILPIFGDHYPKRLDLIDAGVGGVERARDRVEAHFAFDFGFELAAHRVCINPRGARLGGGSACVQLHEAHSN